MAERKSTEIEEINGDLFSDTTSCLVHCVSEDLKMGKGIATVFKRMFGGVSELRSQNPTTGGVCVLQREERFIYYLITKRLYWQKPTYETLRSSLISMRDHCVTNGVANISMPQIGCGLDKLQWDRVKRIIGEVFEDTGIYIKVYHL